VTESFSHKVNKMKKEISAIYGGVNSKVGDLLVNRLLPGRKIEAIGPIVFLDHVYPVGLKNDASIPNGDFAHPHRGVLAMVMSLNA